MHKLTTRLCLGVLLALPVALQGTASAESPASPDRLPPLVTVESEDYTAELVVTADENGHSGFFRRTDDVGSTPAPVPDPFGFVQSSGWPVTGRHCLASGGGEFTFPDAGPHAFTYGIAGRSVRRVVVVMDDGSRVPTAARSGKVDGFRGWMVERPLGEVDRIDGYNARGHKVATITEVGGGDDFGFSIGSCVLPEE